MKVWIYPIATGLFLFTGIANAAKISTNGPPYMAEVGQTIEGCKANPNATEDDPIDGTWVAFSGTAISPTQPYTRGGLVLTRNKTDKILFQDLKLVTGPVDLGTWTYLNTGGRPHTEAKLIFHLTEYRLIAWGFEEFVLERKSPTGHTLEREFSDSSAKVIPAWALAPKKANEDDYDTGSSTIENIGDFNGDGTIDILFRYGAKEAEGLILWLSNSQGKHDMFVSATAYSDCE